MKHLPTLSLTIAGILSRALVSVGEPSTVDSKATVPESRLKLYGWIETGFTGNFASPDDRQNFGRLLDDRSNEPLLNQLVVAAERVLDPKLADRFDCPPASTSTAALRAA